jgi:hypothetical protein
LGTCGEPFLLSPSSPSFADKPIFGIESRIGLDRATLLDTLRKGGGALVFGVDVDDTSESPLADGNLAD